MAFCFLFKPQFFFPFGINLETGTSMTNSTNRVFCSLALWVDHFHAWCFQHLSSLETNLEPQCFRWTVQSFTLSQLDRCFSSTCVSSVNIRKRENPCGWTEQVKYAMMVSAKRNLARLMSPQHHSCMHFLYQANRFDCSVNKINYGSVIVCFCACQVLHLHWKTPVKSIWDKSSAC